MIVCSVCKKFVGNVEYLINGLDEIKDVTGICKKHGRVKADWDDYDELDREGLTKGGARRER